MAPIVYTQEMYAQMADPVYRKLPSDITWGCKKIITYC